MRSTFPTFLLLCLAIASNSGAAEERLAPVKKSKATADEAGNLEVEEIFYVPVAIRLSVSIGNAQNAQNKMVIEVKKKPLLIKRFLAKGAFRVFDAKGRPVGSMAMQQFLKTKRILLIRSNAMKPTAEQLKKLGDDSLLVFERVKILANKPIE